MKAVVWLGSGDVRVQDVPEPKLINPHDAIVKVTLTAICGSDLHLYNGFFPSMKAGDIMGHEFMGTVVEVGTEVSNLKRGDRIVVPFPISCGRCWYCKQGLWSMCDNTNPNAEAVDEMYGFSGAGIYGYSHLTGGYAGGQAEYVRVPFADVCHVKVPDDLPDEKVLFLSDIFPTGYMAAENGGIKPEDVVAVWGCGPVGQFAMKSARLLGAGKVIGIDRFPERLRLAESFAGAETLDYTAHDSVVEELKWRTGGRGPDVCIDAVGMEAHIQGASYAYDRTKQALKLETDRPFALRTAIQACRKGGTVSVVGVYGGFEDKYPMGAFFAKGLTMRAGQCNVQKYMQPLLERIHKGEIDPSAIISHRVPLEQAPEAYRKFRDKEESCIKVVLVP